MKKGNLCLYLQLTERSWLYDDFFLRFHWTHNSVRFVSFALPENPGQNQTTVNLNNCPNVQITLNGGNNTATYTSQGMVNECCIPLRPSFAVSDPPSLFFQYPVIPTVLTKCFLIWTGVGFDSYVEATVSVEWLTQQIWIIHFVTCSSSLST